MKQILIDILQFLLLVIAQVMVSSFADFGPSILICFYPLYILAAPPRSSHIRIMVAAFLLGFLVDFFSNGILGLHASASVLLAFAQPLLKKTVIKEADQGNNQRNIIGNSGWIRFTIYVFLGLSIHHIFLTIVENFGTPFIGNSLKRIILSVILNTVIILMIEFGIFHKKS